MIWNGSAGHPLGIDFGPLAADHSPAPPPPAAVTPGVASLIVPDARAYRPGEQLVFRVVMTQPVVVRGNPRIQIVVGSATRLARFTGGSGTATLTFTYTVTRQDRDLDGITLSDRIRLPKDTRIRTLSGAAVATAIPPADTGGIRVESPPRTRRGR